MYNLFYSAEYLLFSPLYHHKHQRYIIRKLKSKVDEGLKEEEKERKKEPGREKRCTVKRNKDTQKKREVEIYRTEREINETKKKWQNKL